VVVTPEAEGRPEAPGAAEAEHAAAPGRGLEFRIDARKTIGYRVARLIFTLTLAIWFRPKITGKENMPKQGAMILAPVHRSFADFGFAAFLTRRKLFFMAKDNLWKSRPLGRLLLTLGAFPIHRESADRESLQRAETVLAMGEPLVLFPEGQRQEGTQVQELLEGAAFLAARTGAVIVPIGIGNSDRAMPKGSKIPKPLRIRLVIGEPIQPPERSEKGRVSRTKVHELTEELRGRIQSVYDEARG
jgi:1-acyl-sn-glycerol-3-phosphate acyltransferase